MDEQARARAVFFSQLVEQKDFKEFFLDALATKKELALSTLTSTASSERELFTAQGELKILSFIEELLSNQLEKYKRGIENERRRTELSERKPVYSYPWERPKPRGRSESGSGSGS